MMGRLIDELVMMEMDGGVDGVWCGLCVWLIGVGG